MSNLCSLSSTVCPIRLPLNKYPTNELIVNLVNLLLTDYVGNQEQIFFSKHSCQKIIFFEASIRIGQLFLTQFCMILVKPTSKMKIPEKLCGINQDQVDRLRLLTSSSSSKVTSLKITSIPSRPTTRVLNPFHATELF